MNIKKLLSGLLTGAMALSMVNVSIAADDTNIAADWTFDTARQGFDYWLSRGAYSHSTERDHTENGGGSLKCEMKGFTESEAQLVKYHTYEWTQLESGYIYKVTGQVYGETVKDGAAVRFKTFNGSAPKCISESVKIVKDQWTEVSAYILGQTIDWMGFSFTGGNIKSDKNAESGYDVYYLDDVKFEKVIDTNEIEKVIGKLSTNFDFTKKLTAVPMSLDLTGTNTVLSEGEATELSAYSVLGNVGDTWDKVSSTKLDAKQFTATSSDTEVAVFNAATGKIEARSAGTAVLTFKYGEITKPLTVTVYQQGNKLVDYFDYAKRVNVLSVDPIDPDKNAAIVFSGAADDTKSIYTGMETLKPHIVSIRFFVPGTENGKRINLIGNYGNGYTLQMVEESNKQRIMLSSSVYEVDHFSAGWNRLDIIVNYPTNHTRDEVVNDGKTQGYMNGIAYLNGQRICPIGDFLVNKGSVNLMNFNNLMVSDFRVVSLEKTFKINSLSPSADGTMTTLDDIDINLSGEIGAIEDGAVSVTDSDGNAVEVKTLKASKTMLSAKPIGGLKPNTSYTVRIDNTKITDITGAKLSEGAEYTFKTTTDNVSDKIGTGYMLVNSQYDMIGSGNVSLGSGAEITAENEVKATVTGGNKTLFTLNADESFTGDDAAERYIIEYDMKTVAARSEETDDKGNLKYPPVDKEAVKISSIRNDGKTGNVAQIGYSAHGGWFGNKIGLAFDSYFSEDNKISDEGKEIYKLKNDNIDHFNCGSGIDIYKAFVGNILENTGYYHVEMTVDNKATENYGDVSVTVNVTGNDGTAYTYGPIPVRSSDFKSISRLTVMSDDGTAITKELYMKNVNMYALKTQEVQAEDFEIFGITVTDADDTVLTTNSALNGSSISVSYILKNNGLKAEQNYAVTAAVYEKDTNKLVAADVAQGIVNLGAQSDVIANRLDLTKTDSEKSYLLKIFVWDGYNTLKPIISEVILPLE